MAWQPDYATTAELRPFVRETGTDQDTHLALALTAASRAVDHATDRQFGVISAAAIRYYQPIWSDKHGRYLAHIDDLMSITNLVVAADLDDDAVYEETITDYRLWPLNAAGKSFPWTEIVFGSGVSVSTRPGSLQVTALWGWTAVPSTVKNATLIQASRFFKRRDSPYGVAGSPEMGSELRLQARVDPDVAVMLRPYRVWAMV